MADRDLSPPARVRGILRRKRVIKRQIGLEFF